MLTSCCHLHGGNYGDLQINCARDCQSERDCSDVYDILWVIYIQYTNVFWRNNDPLTEKICLLCDSKNFYGVHCVILLQFFQQLLYLLSLRALQTVLTIIFNTLCWFIGIINIQQGIPNSYRRLKLKGGESLALNQWGHSVHRACDAIG